MRSGSCVPLPPPPQRASLRKPRALLVGLGYVMLACAGAACGAEDPMDDTGFPVAFDDTPALLPCTPRPPIAGFVRAEGGKLWLDGARFRGLGANIYYLQQQFTYGLQGSASATAQALAALDDAVCLGFRVIRTPGYNDSQDTAAIRPLPGTYREEGLRGLDQAVAEARARGLRLVITLTNNHADFGGLPAYARWEGLDKDAFFTSAALRRHWEDYATMLVNRVNTLTGVAYRDEPAILAWELGNEFRCRSCPDTSALTATVGTLARHLRGLGVKQLISDGGEGFDDKPALYEGLSSRYPVEGAEGASYAALAALADVDLPSYHFYPRTWGLGAGDDADLWIRHHEEIAATLGKAALFGEFGLRPRAGSPTPDRERAEFFERWLTAFDASDGSLALLWQLIPPARILAGNDGYGVVLGVDHVTTKVLHHWAQRLGP